MNVTDLYGLLVERFGVPEEELTPDTTFRDLDLDSLDLAELAVLVRKRYGVEVGAADRSARIGDLAGVR